MSRIKIRIATKDDAKALLSIYAPYVEYTVVSFEYDVPSVEEFERRITDTLKKYPYLVAEYEGEIVGYALTKPFVGRAAYNWSAETTIYLKPSAQKKGVGKRLYEVLENISRAQNICNLNACIGYPTVEDEYLTKNSYEFHSHIGFSLVGKFTNCGYKFSRWYNMVWMEKIIAEHKEKPERVRPFPSLSDEELKECGVE